MPHTIRFHRVLKAVPAVVYRAFIEPAAMVKWLPPNGYVGEVERLDARVGGTYAMSFTQLATGFRHAWHGVFRVMEAPVRLQYSAVFDDPGMAGEMVTTATFSSVSCGTELVVVQEGVPDVIPVEMCYLGWQESLILLGRLVEV